MCIVARFANPCNEKVIKVIDIEDLYATMRVSMNACLSRKGATMNGLGNATMWSDVESRLIVVGYEVDDETFPVSWWGQHDWEHAACDARDFAQWANDEGIESTWFNVDGECNLALA